jgi:penicillin-binding protein 2
MTFPIRLTIFSNPCTNGVARGILPGKLGELGRRHCLRDGQMPLIPKTERLADRDEKVSAVKLHASQYIVVGLLTILVAGMWRLQILGVDNFRQAADENWIRKTPVMAPRGKLFDREGRIIVDNYPSVSCYLLREQMKDMSDLPLIAKGLHMPVEQVEGLLRRYEAQPKYIEIPLKPDITPDEQAFIEAHRNELPELETRDTQRRLYPKDGYLAHLIGYVGEISEEDLNLSKYAMYEPGDVVGKFGVEEAYDALLRGVDGSREVYVNSHGKELGVRGQVLAKPGQDLKLTIDLDLQNVAEKAMEGKNGALVAMDPHTGEILAMVSRPVFDPNEFAVKLSRAYWSDIVNDQDHPLMNKAIQAQYAPGSTFKIVMSVAGLEEGVAETMHVQCNGGLDIYGHLYKCDHAHGNVDIEHAIPWSCDTYYYTLANRLGIDTIAKYAVSLGFSQKTGIDLPDEKEGTMPSTAWKMKTQHEKWFAGEVISVGIGQGAVQATPIQLARALSGIASGGVLRRPHVVFPDQLPTEMQSAIVSSFPGSGDKTIPLTPENWETITDGMAAATTPGPFNTAGSSHLEGIDFAGKTGTAQVVNHSIGGNNLLTGNARANAWFVGMAPRRNPDIVVVVLAEHGGWGATAAAPFAAQVVNAFVTKQRRREGNLKLAEMPLPAEKPAPKPANAPGTPTAAALPAPAIRQGEGGGRDTAIRGN